MHSPAKVNLMLSVHGRRADGFHELTSLVVALKFGDTLTVRIIDSGEDLLHCSNPEVPSGPDNLVLKAAAAFRSGLGRAVYFEFNLEKRIPMGAGFGGGSSNAVAALHGINQLLETPLDKQVLCEIAAELGSDCPFFIDATPAWICGRGEKIEPLGAATVEQLRGRSLALFKPNFEVDTTWAYERLAANASESYHPEAVNKARVEDSIGSGAFDAPLRNSFEAPVGKKYLAIPTLLEKLRALGVVCLMTGSGSGCFVFPEYSAIELKRIKEEVFDAWGEAVFWVETSIY